MRSYHVYHDTTNSSSVVLAGDKCFLQGVGAVFSRLPTADYWPLAHSGVQLNRGPKGPLSLRNKFPNTLINPKTKPASTSPLNHQPLRQRVGVVTQILNSLEQHPCRFGCAKSR